MEETEKRKSKIGNLEIGNLKIRISEIGKTETEKPLSWTGEEMKTETGRPTEPQPTAADWPPSWTWKPKSQIARPKTGRPLHGPGWCHICGRYTGAKLTLSKFFRGGPVPEWAVVHRGCDYREKPAQFRERLKRWLADRQQAGGALPTAAGDAANVVDTGNEPTSGRTLQAQL